MQWSNFFIFAVLIFIGIINYHEINVQAYRLDERECVTQDTNQNTYIGQRKVSILNNVTFCSYQGIPYAEPPVGQRRFKDPVALEPRGEEIRASQDSSECMQIEPLFNMGKVIGSEDCLYLNVYTQHTSNTSQNPLRLKAVMVWIHGGGFVFGSGSESIYGPDFLIEHNIILVTFNYRLGAFGFLNLRNEDVPGNAGLKDQVLVLKWVQRNIQSFGGDPNSVTLFGESAGASSIQLHMMSNLSKGLFHRAILQSGSVYCPWTYIRDPLQRAEQLANQLGLNVTEPNRMADALRNVSSYQIAKVQSELTKTEDLDKGFYFPFIPSTELLLTGNNFITEDPDILLKSGRFMKIPTIVGVNSREGIMVLLGKNASPAVLDTVDKNFQRVVPDILYLTPRSKKFKEVTDKIKRFYFEDGQLSWDSLENYVDEYRKTFLHNTVLKIELRTMMFILGAFNCSQLEDEHHCSKRVRDSILMGDIYFVAPIYRSMMNMIEKSTESVYCYEFAFEGRRGLAKTITMAVLTAVNISGNTVCKIRYHDGDFSELIGCVCEAWYTKLPDSLFYCFQDTKRVSHYDDIAYLFPVTIQGWQQEFLNSSMERKTIDRLTSLWTNFAKTGNPNGTGLSRWEPNRANRERCLYIGNEIETRQRPFFHRRMHFWKDIYDNHSNNSEV